MNYNHIGFENLNEYLLKLYSPFFPNIVFITPNIINKSNEINIMPCNDSFYGYYSYICFKNFMKNIQIIKDIYLLMMIFS